MSISEDERLQIRRHNNPLHHHILQENAVFENSVQFFEILVIAKILGFHIPRYHIQVIWKEILCQQKRRQLFKIVLVACKKAITKRCHKPDPPRQDEWLKTVSEIFVLERLTLMSLIRRRLREMEELQILQILDRGANEITSILYQQRDREFL